jgi:hypothetical protein
MLLSSPSLLFLLLFLLFLSFLSFLSLAMTFADRAQHHEFPASPPAAQAALWRQRKPTIDGWNTLSTKPIDQPIDLAA